MTVKASSRKKKRGGVRLGPDGKPLQGRRKGIRNRKTVERELVRARELAQLALIEKTRLKNATAQVELAIEADTKLGKEILSDFANMFAAAARYYQPIVGVPKKKQPKQADAALFLKYSELAVYAADKLAPYQSPRLAAMMIGATQTKKIAITGGLPSAHDEQPQLPPDLYEDSQGNVPQLEISPATPATVDGV